MHAVVMYLGAGLLLSPDLARKLDSRKWAYQPKLDGAYATVTTDANGAIVLATSRSGRAWDLDGLEDIRTIPSAVLCCEVERHTEASVVAVRNRGFQLVHIFDALELAGAPLASLSYADRYQAIMRAIAEREVQQGEWQNAAGNRRAESGRFMQAAPIDVRRTPLVPMLRGASGFDEMWSSYVEREQGEGLVAVRLDAQAGKRNAKRKVKTTDTVSARLSPGNGNARLAQVMIYGQRVIVGMPEGMAYGDVVDIAHNGFYNSGLPRFARVVRKRLDLN